MEGSARTEAAAPRARAVSQLLPILVIAAAALGLGWAHRARLRRLPAPSVAAEEPGAPWIDPGAARVTSAPDWTDPRWLEHVQGLLQDEAPFAAGAPPALDELAARLGALSFVERVERCELTAEGLDVELVLRRPVACIPCSDEFALVDAHGVVLEGRWPVPPRLGRAFLPVLGPAGDPLFARARAGDWLVEPEHTDALDVARSLEQHLGADERATLGRILIDARGARTASVADPGVRLELEGERLALFGRAPSSREPGELAPEAKWRALARALALYQGDPEGGDWELVDLRWDRPDLALRTAPEVAALDPATARASAPGRARERAPLERDDGRPRVR